ncbi:MAG: nucleotide sugar dehydrogenase [Leptospirales bacterium]
MDLLKKIEEKKAVVGIIGCGYVGLPLALEFAKKSFHVIAFDVDTHRVGQIMKKISYIPDVSSEELGFCVDLGTLEATTDFRRLAEVDTISVCVPTPLRKTRDPDVSYIVESLVRITENRRPNQLIVLESTTYPGTTREILFPELEKKGEYEVGTHYFLAFSPERVDPGNPKYNIVNTPKVIGGMTPACMKIAQALYGSIVERVVPVSSPESAEMVKLLENTFRSVNIGLVNELALMSHPLNVNIWEVIEAAATKPFGFMPFFPGPGLGGHCIPIDPHYLSWKARQFGFEARFIELAGVVNGTMPHHVVSRISHALNNHYKCLRGARILIVGVAYKRDVNDLRESPALDVMTLLEKEGALISYADPFIPEIQLGKTRHASIDITKNGLLKDFDCGVIITDHTQMDYTGLLDILPVIVDTRNALKAVTSREKIVTL